MANCLLIIDVQNGFINEHTQHVIPLIEKAQSNFAYVIATQFHNPPNSFFRNLLGWHKLERDSTDFSFAFVVRKDALLIEKSTYSFVNSNFLNQLGERNIDTVHICGIDTDICVMKCAVDLIESGKIPIVVTKLCASTKGASYHDAAIEILRRFIGQNQVV